MGLRALEPSRWLEVDDLHGADVDQKRRLLERCPEQVLAVVADPDGRVAAAAQELLDRLVAHLATHHPALDRTVDESRHPVDSAGRLTQEDWCVHLPDDQDRWRLVAASVCFPTRWDLTTKIGRTLREIHAPVPLYDQQLADPMDAYFARMRPQQAVWRLNWNITDDPVLHQPHHDTASSPPAAHEVGGRVWLRVERQTLVKLPRTGAIVFGIRVHVDPLDSMAHDVETLTRLRAALAALPAEVLEDKQLVELRPTVDAWLSSALAAGGDGPPLAPEP
jgi:hypothetical protein